MRRGVAFPRTTVGALYPFWAWSGCNTIIWNGIMESYKTRVNGWAWAQSWSVKVDLSLTSYRRTTLDGVTTTGGHR